MSLFEESARVPLIIMAPGNGQQDVAARTPVGLIDLYPTLAELCGVSVPDNLQGQSLAPILADPTLPGRGWTLSQVRRGPRSKRTAGYTLRTPRWRYTEWDQARQGRELYDHENDPLEQNNLAADPSHEDQVAEFSTQLKEAVAASHPESGRVPAIRDGTWAPNLTDP